MTDTRDKIINNHQSLSTITFLIDCWTKTSRLFSGASSGAFSASFGEMVMQTDQKSDSKIPVVQLGLGNVGGALLDIVTGSNQQKKFRVCAVADRSGVLVDRSGFDDDQISKFIQEKAKGKGVAKLTNEGDALTNGEAVRSLFDSSEPGILVDVTDSSEVLPFYWAAVEGNWKVAAANKIPITRISFSKFTKLLEADLKYEATVGAGLPIITTIKRLRSSRENIHQVSGVFSGSLAYITRQVGEGKLFSTAVADAKSAGYTEPDPRVDLLGRDVARKALILARSLGEERAMSDVDVEPLVPLDDDVDNSWEELENELQKYDAEFQRRLQRASQEGSALCYLARVTRNKIKVGLEEVKQTSPVAQGTSTANVAVIEGEHYSDSPLVISGPGAGPTVTAQGVYADMQSLATDHLLGRG